MHSSARALDTAPLGGDTPGVGAWRTTVGSVDVAPEPPRSALLLPRPEARVLLPRPGDGGPTHTVLTAPLGYGKTTLLAEHARDLRSAGHAVAWCDVGALLRAPGAGAGPEVLVEAVGRAVAQALAPAVPAQRPAGRGRAPAGSAAVPAVALPSLVDALGALDTPLVLVLDDVGGVTDPGALAVLGELAAVAERDGSDGGELRLVWAGRREPAVGLGRARATDRVVDLDASRLRPGPDEVSAVLARAGRQAAEDVAAGLLERSAGWPLALHLLLRQELTGGPGDPVRRHLDAEVLAPLGPDVVRVLRRVAVPVEAPAGLAVRCAGRDDAVAVLESVAAGTGLVERHDDDRTVYRLHPVLRRTLLAGADEDAEAVRRAHLEASRWAGRAGDRAGAVEHAAAGGDDGLLASTLLHHGLGMVLEGGAARLRELLRARAGPDSPAVEVVHHLLACLSLSDAATADALLVHVRTLRGGDGWSQRCEQLLACAVLRRLRFPDRPHPPEAAATLAALRDPAHRDRLPVDVVLHVMLDLAALDAREGRTAAAAEALGQVRTLAGLYRYPDLELHCLVQLAGVAAAGTGVVSARVHAVAALDHARATSREASPALTFAHVLLAWSAYQLLDDRAAAEHLARAMVLLPRAVDPAVEVATRFCDVVLRFAGGDRRAALLRLRPLLDAVRDDPVARPLATTVLPRAVRMHLAQGDWAAARQSLDLTDRLLPGTGEAALAHARWHRARHREELSLRLLAADPGFSTTGARLDALLLRAVLLEEDGDRGGSHEALVEALAVAEPEAAVRPFAEAGPSLVPVLVQACGRVGELEPWLSRVTGLVLGSHDAVPHADPELVGLTPREMAVLAELPTLLPLQAIAERHHVSLNTCKTQVKAIYRKLGVSDRQAAVEAARRSGLLRA